MPAYDANDNSMGLQRRDSPRSRRVRTAAIVTTSGAGLAATVYVADPIAHAANALVHSVGIQSAGSVAIGAGATAAMVGVMASGRDLNHSAYARGFTFAGVAASGGFVAALGIGTVVHDMHDAVVGGVVGGVLGTFFGTGFSSIGQDGHNLNLTTGYRRIALASSVVGVAGIAGDAAGQLGLHGIANPALMGHVGLAGFAAAAVPAATIALQRHAQTRQERAAKVGQLGE